MYHKDGGTGHPARRRAGGGGAAAPAGGGGRRRSTTTSAPRSATTRATSTRRCAARRASATTSRCSTGRSPSTTARPGATSRARTRSGSRVPPGAQPRRQVARLRHAHRHGHRAPPPRPRDGRRAVARARRAARRPGVALSARRCIPGMCVHAGQSSRSSSSYGGKIWRVPVADGRGDGDPVHRRRRPADRSARVKFEYPHRRLARSPCGRSATPRPSPDGKRLAFTALDRLWVDGPARAARRAALDDDAATAPASSSSRRGRPTAGRRLRDVERAARAGTSAEARADGRTAAAPQRLTRSRRFYDKPACSPDGRRIVAVARPARSRRARRRTRTRRAGARVVPAGRRRRRHVIAPLRGCGTPHFVRRDTSAHLRVSGGERLVSMRWDGTDAQAHLRVDRRRRSRGGGGGGRRAGRRVLMSPDGDQALAQVGQRPLPRRPCRWSAARRRRSRSANPAAAAVPVRRLTRRRRRVPALGDGRRAACTTRSATRYFALRHRARATAGRATRRRARDARARRAARGAGGRRVARGRAPVAAGARRAADARRAYEPTRARRDHHACRRDRPRGIGGAARRAHHHDEGRRGDRERRRRRARQPHRRRRRARLGRRSRAGARVIDVTGKTIMPGFVDTHAHLWPACGVHRAQPWEYLATSPTASPRTRDPQTATTDVLSYEDQVEAGDILGPRIYSTGPGRVLRATNIRSLDDARDVLRRYSRVLRHEDDQAVHGRQPRSSGSGSSWRRASRGSCRRPRAGSTSRRT